MAFLYFAYGSNLWPQQMCSRCPSARPVGKAVLSDWAVVYDKPGSDGTAKLNLRESEGTDTHGVVYEIDDSDRRVLDRAEPGYTPFRVLVTFDDGRSVEALTYRWTSRGTSALPADWYVSLALRGARFHGLSPEYVSTSLASECTPDPLAPGISPAGREDLGVMQEVLSTALASDSDGYTLHPGELAWWMWHADPRQPDRLSYWVIPAEGVLVIDAVGGEISAFTTPGSPVSGLIEWSQRRLGGDGEVGWVANSDRETISYLRRDGYRAVRTNRLYHWDLNELDVPDPDPPPGFRLRPLAGEEEAAERRKASHAAFDSTMNSEMHLRRYLRFMRSPVYERRRDLVAEAPDGRIASFMIWWPDTSGIAQIEPFGTHPDFQGRGVGRALISHGLAQMRQAGMDLVRVVTEEHRSAATAFYESVGFVEADRIRWWKRAV